MAFQFEKLEVYQKSLDWVEAVESLCESLKGKASYSLIDQQYAGYYEQLDVIAKMLTNPVKSVDGLNRGHPEK